MIQLTPHHSKVLHALHNLSVDLAWSEQSFESLLCLPTTTGFATDDLSCFILYSMVMDEAEILTVATHPDHRRQGLAREILLASFHFLKENGIQTLRLEVDVTNLPAIYLYQKLGFQNYGQRPNYYKSALGILTDAKLMQKKL